jgi:hypothetical protein
MHGPTLRLAACHEFTSLPESHLDPSLPCPYDLTPASIRADITAEQGVWFARNSPLDTQTLHTCDERRTSVRTA